MKIMDLDFDKMGGLIPAIVQDANTNKVLMLGYMNREALEMTNKTGKVTFYSRTKKTVVDKRRRKWQFSPCGGHFGRL